MEAALFNGVDHFLAQAQMAHIARRNNHALLAGELAFVANRKEAFNLFIQAAYRLNVAELIDRTCYRNLLINRLISQRADQGAQFGQRGAVPVDFRVGLLKYQRCGEGQLLIQLQFGDQIRLHDHHAFRVDVATQLSFALDIGKFAVAWMNHAGNARRFAPGTWMAWKLHDGKAVDLADNFAFGFNQDLF